MSKLIQIILSSTLIVDSYMLLPYRNISSPDINFYGCTEISTDLIDTTKSVMRKLNEYDLFKFSYIDEIEYGHGKNGFNTICNLDLDEESSSRFGYCRNYSPYFNESDIGISDKLSGNNLYNVVLHELIHSVGLDHTLIPGIMNYSIISTTNGYVRDNNKLWLSVDDYSGMKFTYSEVVDEDEDEEIKCNKKRIIKLINKCL